MQELCEEDRRAGYSAEEVIDDNIRVVSRRFPAWREALEDTRDAWRAAYEGVAGPGDRLSPALLEHLAHREPARKAA
jgi:hypothetical protein